MFKVRFFTGLCLSLLLGLTLTAAGVPVIISDNTGNPSGLPLGYRADVSEFAPNVFRTAAFDAPLDGTLTTVSLFSSTSGPATVLLNLFDSVPGGFGGVGVPGSLIGSLVSPASLSGPALNTFTASGLALTAGSRYWIVLQPLTGTFGWIGTATTTGSGAGYVGGWGESSNGGASWSTSPVPTRSPGPFMMQVTMDAVTPGAPELDGSAAPAGLTCMMVLLIGLRRRLGLRTDGL